MADWLRVRGEGAGGRLDVDDELTVGREQPGLGAVADDVELSRRHASFVHTESGGLAVEDLGSTNGTFVNGKRISGRTELRPGDVVQVGATELEVVGDPTTQKTPPAESPRDQAEPRRSRSGSAAGGRARSSAAAAGRSTATACCSADTGSPRAPPPRPPDRSGSRCLPSCSCSLWPGWSRALLGRDDDKSAATVAAEPAYDGTAYVLSNRQQPGQNSVIAIRYGPNGFDPLRLREYPTKGVGTSEAGMGAPTDGDQQIQVDRKRKLLFAVNQGSDTVAVFRILDDGGLEHVKGSPFPSGGDRTDQRRLERRNRPRRQQGLRRQAQDQRPRHGGAVPARRRRVPDAEGHADPHRSRDRPTAGARDRPLRHRRRAGADHRPLSHAAPRRGRHVPVRPDHAVDRRAARARDAAARDARPATRRRGQGPEAAAAGPASAPRASRSIPSRTSCTPSSRR